jgi:hypothetical protein
MDRENILRKGILTTPGGNIFFRTAEIVSINPLYPPILGDSYSWGTPPDPRQEESCTYFSAVSLYVLQILGGNEITLKHQ